MSLLTNEILLFTISGWLLKEHLFNKTNKKFSSFKDMSRAVKMAATPSKDVTTPNPYA